MTAEAVRFVVAAVIAVRRWPRKKEPDFAAGLRALQRAVSRVHRGET